MNPIELARVDLNLLVTLDVLLLERSVTLAGRRLGRTPSAMSHALGRLRELFGDPLLVRAGHQLVPTPAAEALRAPLAELLRGVAGLLRQTPFDPARARRSFRIIASDYLQRLILPGLTEVVRTQAPGVDLHILPVQANLEQTLAEDAADLALGVALTAPESLRMRALGADHFVCVARPDAWTCGDDPARWAALPHVLVAPGGRPGGPVDSALAALGLRRRIALTLSNFLAALDIVATTDLVLTLPGRLAAALAPPGLLHRPPPLALPPIRLLALWHPRVDAEPGHQWLRERLPVVGCSH